MAARSAAPPDDAPLRVRISTLTPSSLPENGVIEVTGSVTNRSVETWTTINLYSFLGDDLPPMTNAAQIAAALDTPNDQYVGERIVSSGDPGQIEELPPGQTDTFSLRVPVSAFDVTAGGVYWFGVQAIGTGTISGRDEDADGRARTLLPYLPPRVNAPLRAAMVVPVTRAVAFRSDGAVDLEEQWVRTLEPGGRLHDLVAFGAEAGPTTPLTWLLDPALIDVVQRLAEGNPPRSLTPTVSPTGTPTGEPLDDEPPAEPEDTPLTRAATAWLALLVDAVEGDEVLRLPYGNLDVAAAVRYEPDLLTLARTQNSRALTELGIESSPALAAPNGYLDPASLRVASEPLDDSDDDDAASAPPPTVLLTDAMLTGIQGPPPAVVELNGQRVLFTSRATADGGPGPGPFQTSIGLRQRFLAEAAVRRLQPSRHPLVSVLPTDWGLDSPSEFFAGLAEAGWVDLDTAGQLQADTEPVQLLSADVDFPRRQQRRELDPPTLREASRLVDAGNLLQRLIVGNNQLGATVSAQALAMVGYPSRPVQNAVREQLLASRAWLDDYLAGVQIKAAKGVTLSSESGTFSVSLTNNLDHTVLVGLTATSDAGIEFSEPEPVELAPGARTNVNIRARTSSNKVHNVTLQVTDRTGEPLGPTAELPIRSAQVSDVIWVIMGTGVGVLFVAIPLRLYRRIRRERAEVRAGGPAA